jgi:hypothetical protein
MGNRSEFERAGLIQDNEALLRWAETHQADIHIEPDTLDGRKVRKVILRWPGPGGPGSHDQVDTVWFDPDPLHPVKQRSDLWDGGVTEARYDYPAPENVPADLLTFQPPRDVTLEINDPDLGRQVYSEARATQNDSANQPYQRSRAMNHGTLRGTNTLAVGLLAAGVGVAMAARNDQAESEEARAIKAQFARQVERIKSLEVAYKLETKSNLSPEKLRALPEHMNQLFLPQDEWHEAFKGQKRYRRRIQPEHIAYLAPVNENGLYAPREPPADAPPLIKENQKKLKLVFDSSHSDLRLE